MNDTLTRVDYWRALEALRNGVPNRDAVRVLGCSQPDAEERFINQLSSVTSAAADNAQVAGTLVSGGFGTGKSHLLEYFQHLALSRNFVCSRVVISKETPLHDPTKMFKAAIDSAEVPGLSGSAISEAAQRLRPNSAAYVDFYKWVNRSEDEIGPIFAATLFLHERLKNDPELVEQITGFWAGEPMSVASVRQGLRQCGALVAYPVKAVPARSLALQRLKFASQFFAGAGYAGWVVLIDEVELVGRYSLLQRGKSYAELARWLGRTEGDAIPGLTAVAAITDDFDLAVLQEKGDLDYIGPKLRDRGTEEYAVIAARAETGMRTIAREAINLQPPNATDLEATYRRLQEIHGAAYEWDPPELGASQLSTRRAMRSFVRRWINEWDLSRLYPGIELATQEEELRPSYGEDIELEQPSEELPQSGHESVG